MTSLDRQPVSGYGVSSRPQPDSLADLLERVLDKGIVIAGDIRVNLLDIELLTIKIRLLVVSVDKAMEMGIDWWTRDPMLSSSAEKDELERSRSTDDEALDQRGSADRAELGSADRDELERLRRRVEELEAERE